MTIIRRPLSYRSIHDFMKSYILLLCIIVFSSCNSDKKSVEKIDKIQSSKNEIIDFNNLIGNDYLIDDQHSYLGFKIKYFGFSPVRGRFNEFDGTMFFDGSNLSSLSTSVFIDATTINTGNNRRDNDLKSDGSWFDVANFPMIQFTSTQVILKEDGSFDLIGDLTMKGITLSDTISFDKPTAITKDWADNDQVDFAGRVTINRQDYNVFGGDFWSSVMENGLTQLSDEVEIEIDMHCRKADYQARYEAADSLDLNKMILDVIKTEGIDRGFETINELKEAGKLTAGKLSSIGYTLSEWGRYEEALEIFHKRQELFPHLNSTWNQRGITNLKLKNYTRAIECFNKALEGNSSDSRAIEYLRIIQQLESNSN